MERMQIIEKSRKVEKLLGKYSSLIGGESELFEKEFSIDNAEKLKLLLENREKEGRQLRIGIVGRVKAGKSSLLNGLVFDGKNVLPQAATPMTAALTQISFGDEFSVEVNFFSKNEIAHIKEKHDEYKVEFHKLFEEKKTLLIKRRNAKSEKGNEGFLDKAKSSAQNILPLSKEDLDKFDCQAKKEAENEMLKKTLLSACYDHYSMILKAKVSVNNEKLTIPAKSIQDINRILLDYVGVDGKHTAFTKSVEIKVPFKNLKKLLLLIRPE